uniref:CCHC-type domain-containing protein n=1 Tax=Heliothis virescens TaxID=7102 RepID=A0A2A4JH77_HELVI
MADSKDTGLNMYDMTKFSGEDHTYTSVKWAQDLEDNAEIFQWTPQQQLIIARRSLTGTAELWLKTEKVHKTYEELRAAVLKEFPDTVSSKEMHERMAARKKRKDESYYQYMLIMKEMGKRAKFPDYVAIQYIIDGISDLETNKAILYGAVTYPALKEKLVVYETIKKRAAKQHAERTAVKQGASREPVISGTGKPCYNCGEKNHRASACRNGVKCFRCNEFGHIAPQCTNQSAGNSGTAAASVKQSQRSISSNQHTQQARASVKQDSGIKKHSAMFGASSAANDSDSSSGHVETMTDDVDIMQIVNKPKSRHNKAVKIVKVCNKTISALIDTGSDVNLISEDLWCGLKVPRSDDNTVLSGLGLCKVRSYGMIFVSLQIDDKYYNNVTFHIVPKGTMPYELIIGQEFLKNVVMVVREGAVLLLTQGDEWLSRVNCCVTEVDVTGHISDDTLKMEVKRLVEDYRPIQTKEAPITMKIVLKDDVPIVQRPRRISLMEQKLVEEQVDDWLQKGIIQVSYSEYSSPLVLVKKKDGSTRICVDYRLLNKKIVKDEFPLPIIEDLIDSLKGAKIYSVLDLKNGFFSSPD